MEEGRPTTEAGASADTPAVTTNPETSSAGDLNQTVDEVKSQTDSGLADSNPTATPPATGDLPHGWFKQIDPNTGFPYFYNSLTGTSQWEDPTTMPQLRKNTGASTLTAGEASGADATGYEPYKMLEYDEPKPARPQYIPSVHGNYADYVAKYGKDDQAAPKADGGSGTMTEEDKRAHLFQQQAAFDKRTGAFQRNTRDYSDHARASNQMNHYFDYSSWSASQDGRSLKEERRNQKLTKKQVAQFKVTKKQKKERKERAWLES